jgi:O-succinylbenzoate synthase
MKIDNITAYLVRIPLKTPFRFADSPIDHVDTVVVRISSGGVDGWGEVFAGNTPALTGEWSRGVFETINSCLLPLVRGVASISSAETLNELLLPVKGNRHAKASLDMAWWDLHSRLDNKPLHKAIGGTKDVVEVGLVFDRFDDQTQLYETLKRAEADNYRRITFKIRPGWEVPMLAWVSSEFPSFTLQADVEGALSMESNMETLSRFDDFVLQALEQPIAANDFVGHAMLGESMRAPICLDESITSLADANIAIDLHSAKVFCLKSGRVGGITEAKRIHDAALAQGIKSYSSFDIQTSIGYRFALALGSLQGCELPTDYIPLNDYLTTDIGRPITTTVITEPKPTRVVELWKEPGIGFEPDVKMIEKLAVMKSE